MTITTIALCFRQVHYTACEYEDAETCQNGPSWHFTMFGQGWHAVAECDGTSCPVDEGED